MSEERNSGFKNWAVFSGIAIQMGVIIGLGAFLGIKLDEYFTNSYSVFTIILSLLGVFVSMYVLIRQLQNLNKKE